MEIFKSPVGTLEDRKAGMDPKTIWPKPWVVSNPFDVDYKLDSGISMGFHTGIDLVNGGNPFGKPVYAIGAGIVKYARAYPVSISSTWGNIVVIYHGVYHDADGDHPIFTRYGHLSHVAVHEKQVVDSETEIGNIGSGPAGAGMPAHLHFDISKTNILDSDEKGGAKSGAGHWPRVQNLVETHYVNPVSWFLKPHTLIKDINGHSINNNQPAGAASISVKPPVATSNNATWVVIAKGTKVREKPDKKDFAELEIDAQLILPEKPHAELQGKVWWVQITDGHFKGYWVTHTDENNVLHLRKSSV